MTKAHEIGLLPQLDLELWLPIIVSVIKILILGKDAEVQGRYKVLFNRSRPWLGGGYAHGEQRSSFVRKREKERLRIDYAM